MTRYSTMFHALKQKNDVAFIPFFMLGDPCPDESLALIRTAIEAGADALELGLPFSDPMADGPAIQHAVQRAQRSHATTKTYWSLLRTIREDYPSLPIGLLVYANLIHAAGLSSFYHTCNQHGIDAVLVPDLPLSERQPFHDSAVSCGVSPIYICPPNMTKNDCLILANEATAFIYLVARTGVTGINTPIQTRLHPAMSIFETQTDHPPLVLGFGLSQPDQVKAASQSAIDGVITGSAIATLIETHHTTASRQEALAVFIKDMKNATCR